MDRREGVKNSPRHHALMAGRHPHRSSFNWIYVFCGVLLTFLTVLLILNTSTIQSLSPLHSLNADRTSIPVAHLTLKIAELQAKLLTAAQESAKRTAAPKQSLGGNLNGARRNREPPQDLREGDQPIGAACVHSQTKPSRGTNHSLTPGAPVRFLRRRRNPQVHQGNAQLSRIPPAFALINLAS
jgi:hypothetical protein